MTRCPPSTQYTEALERAQRLACARRERAVTSTHLLLAVMSQFNTPWPKRIVECGGLDLRLAFRRLGWKSTEDLQWAAERPDARRSRASMRLMVVVFVAAAGWVVLGLLRARRSATPDPPLDGSAVEIVTLAERVAATAVQGSSPTRIETGHLLLALTIVPGKHLRLLDNATVTSCATRKDLRLASPRHRAILACDRPNMAIRRTRMRIDREISTHGCLSWWGAAWLGYGAGGLLLAAALFPITVLANLLLYLCLWPAAILMVGVRALCGAVAGCQTVSHRWHEIPGGDVALASPDRRLSGRSLLIALLAPRFLAFLFGVAALTVILWRTQRLGVVLSPPLFRRPDLISGAASESIWVTPASFLEGMLDQNGTLGGIGLLAGLGAGVMSMPTYRELETIRLHTGHEAGRGSRLARGITLPAAILTWAIACVEAVLPFRNGPIYLTVYVVPLFLSLALAAAILALMPY